MTTKIGLKLHLITNPPNINEEIDYYLFSMTYDYLERTKLDYIERSLQHQTSRLNIVELNRSLKIDN